ncbi:magnesium protoporphyrin IX methyltransferase, chloroplastic [Canna indica]|uniref:Magnesium protoporphyrin IX methyltransferase, chloroplastic n=1 Tax=Canna indica TaxID=4628 RepID=A0AAQ3PYX7_9LILI|nr:magnesium protoporphyrin IX methyltransferase, chloroplastic [Canna indica]
MASTAILFSATATPADPRRHSHLHPLSPKPRVRLSTATRTLALPPAADLPALDAPVAIAAASSVAALAAALSLSDPERRRRQQAEEVGGTDKEVVREYFNNTGFERWKKIYGEATEDVNRVQLDIRLGHAQTVENTLRMLRDGGPLSGMSVCDAGCGTGSLTVPLAKEGALVTASDISAAMVAEAERKAREALSGQSDVRMPNFEVKDLESLSGKFHTVVCLDVLIHYPQEKAEAMIAHLASLAESRLVLSFAPKTVYYDLLKRVGELFPGPSKATRAYLHAERDVERALEKVGWKWNHEIYSPEHLQQKIMPF